MAALSGAETMVALEEARRGLQAASTELSQLITTFYKASEGPEGETVLGTGLQFDVAIKDELSFIYTNAIANTQRLPPADIREAMAHQAVQTKHEALWAKYHTDKARIEALKSWISSQKAAITACQSVLKGERE